MSLDIEDHFLDDSAPKSNGPKADASGSSLGFRRLPFHSPQQREGAQLALRIIDECDWSGRLVDRRGNIDSEVLTLIGLEEAERESALTPAMKMKLISEMP